MCYPIQSSQKRNKKGMSSGVPNVRRVIRESGRRGKTKEREQSNLLNMYLFWSGFFRRSQ